MRYHLEYKIYHKNGLILEKEGKIFKLTDFDSEHYGYAVSDGKINVVCEERNGFFVLFYDTEEGIKQETLLCSRRNIFQNREINIEVLEKDLYLFFSAYYKQKKIILFYRKLYPVRVLDVCDNQPFQTLAINDGKILVLYQKNGVLGYRVVSGEVSGNFTPVDAKNSVKMFFWQNNVWLLALEEQYILYQVTQKKRYTLPLVFYQKPFLLFLDNKIEIRYRFQHKSIIYEWHDGVINFLREEY